MYSTSLRPYPSSWYCLGFSEELPKQGVVSKTLAGEELVLFRTATGAPAVLGAYCPHLGAHMGHGGVVEGETVRCPFHGFCFDAQGACTKTGYGTKPPPKARARAWPVLERHGLLFAYYDEAGRAPTWEIPDVSTEGWTTIRNRKLRFRGHVQEVAENSVDIGHLTWIHGYKNVREVSKMQTDGHYLTAKYGMERPRKAFGASTIATEFEIHQYGLGYARVEVDVLSLGIHTRQFVLARPLNGDEIELQLGMAIKHIAEPKRIHPALAVAPKGWLTNFVANASIKEFEADVKQDLPIWRNKAYLEHPALAAGDGPVGLYRKWARQFYGEAVREAAG